MAAALRLKTLTPLNTVFFECDIQQKLSRHIFKSASVAHNAKRFAQLSKAMKIPVIATR